MGNRERTLFGRVTMRSRVAKIGGVVCLVSTFVACWSGPTPAPGSRTVDLTALDGVNLKASFFPAAAPGPGVLLLHQCNRQRRVWDGLAEQLAAAGINVLTVDNRGFGESGGVRFDQATPQQAMELQAKWPGDFDVALQYLKSRPGVKADVIGVGGASCGVNNSVQTARRHQEVKSLVLLSGNTDINGREFLRKSNLPAFFALADDDEFKPTVLALQWLYSLTSTPQKKFLRYKTGGHGADIFPVHPDLPAAITDWFVTTLIKTPGSAPASNGSPELTAAVSYLEEIDLGRATKVQQELAEARKHDPKASLFPEDLVNFMGYERLQARDTRYAVEIMKLNAFAYPDSPNAFDSLADACLADGQKDLARQSAKKALDLLPSDTADPPERRDVIRAAAERKLKELGGAT